MVFGSFGFGANQPYSIWSLVAALDGGEKSSRVSNPWTGGATCGSANSSGSWKASIAGTGWGGVPVLGHLYRFFVKLDTLNFRL